MKTNQLLRTAGAAKTLKAGIFAAALFCSASVFAQVKIGSNPTSINAANNLEVEASTAGRKTSIDKTTGQVTIKDGTEGTGKVLTSDATGGASWQPIRATSVTSTIQTAPGVVLSIPPSPGPSGGTFCALPLISSSPAPACAVDLNRNASFTITNPVNDVVIDATGITTLAGGTGKVQFFFLLYIDKTTPGVFELVDKFYLATDDLGCAGYYLNFKSAFKNLPPRAYNVKMYGLNWFNGGTTTAYLGVGSPSFPLGGCGAENIPSDQKVIITVSE